MKPALLHPGVEPINDGDIHLDQSLQGRACRIEIAPEPIDRFGQRRGGADGSGRAPDLTRLPECLSEGTRKRNPTGQTRQIHRCHPSGQHNLETARSDGNGRRGAGIGKVFGKAHASPRPGL